MSRTQTHLFPIPLQLCRNSPLVIKIAFPLDSYPSSSKKPCRVILFCRPPSNLTKRKPGDPREEGGVGILKPVRRGQSLGPWGELLEDFFIGNLAYFSRLRVPLFSQGTEARIRISTAHQAVDEESLFPTQAASGPFWFHGRVSTSHH